VDLVREPAVSRIAGKVDQGSWLDPSDPRGVVLGRQLARTLCASPGAELVVLTQAADGSMANDLFTVRGVLLGIAEGTDRSAVFLPADTFRDLMALPDGAHQVVVRRGAMDLDAAAAAVRGLAPGLEVKTWRELAPILGQMMDSTRGLVLIFLFVIYVAVGILVLNAMLMAVFERIREFGVLKAIGAGPLRVFGLILVESSIQTFAATVLGLAAAAPFMALLSTRGVDVGVLGGVDAMGIAMRPVWHGIYGPEALATPVVMLWAIVGLAVAWPALKAAWIDPVRAMHHH
jgi:ABC-type lipoprotein release transport system permease subunit